MLSDFQYRKSNHIEHSNTTKNTALKISRDTGGQYGSPEWGQGAPLGAGGLVYASSDTWMVEWGRG